MYVPALTPFDDNVPKKVALPEIGLFETYPVGTLNVLATKSAANALLPGATRVGTTPPPAPKVEGVLVDPVLYKSTNVPTRK
jgi:hypothetical protein